MTAVDVDALDAARAAAREALIALKGLHTNGAHGMCAGCGWTFPCPTIAVLAAGDGER